ncbi:hypothetical protein [Nannocystis pusilla]|uniref:hypothetical protein n=1 Tax=Nannocystis pusilla TaxID=889268 RepID=UPI003B78906E
MREVDGGAAMLLLALGGEDGDIAAIEAALADRKRRPAALWALGFHGTPEVVEVALEWLEDPVAGRWRGGLLGGDRRRPRRGAHGPAARGR